MDGSTTEVLSQPLELKSSRNFFWDKSYAPNNCARPYEYKVSDEGQTAIKQKSRGLDTIQSSPGVSEEALIAYFRLNVIGETNNNGQAIGLMDERNTHCHTKCGAGFVVACESGHVYLNRVCKGKLYPKKEKVKKGDIICAKGNLKTDEFSLSLIRDGCKFGNEINVIWRKRKGRTVRPAMSFDGEKWSVTLL